MSKYCPRCKGSSRVTQTEIRATGMIVRRRKCSKCRKSYHTWEIIADHVATALHADRSELLKLRRQLSNVARILNGSVTIPP